MKGKIFTIALLYFYRKNVDFVVLETGLGGLYDCTNIITKPIVSVKQPKEMKSFDFISF